MPDHLTRPRPQPPRRPAHVLFFACVPPAAIRDEIAEAWQSSGTARPFRHDKLHMSILPVAGLDILSPTLIEQARRAASGLRSAPFELCFDRLATFGGGLGNCALVLTTDGQDKPANALALDLHDALRAAGLVPPGRRKIVPHLTLAYGPGFSEIRPLAKPIRWAVRDITLIDSLQGQGRHVWLGTWPLVEGRQQPSFDF
jgi:RNA 2',3'-cyclic 3'-phosphodiesterase